MNWWAKHTNPKNYQKRVDTEPFRFISTLYEENDSVFEAGCGTAVWIENHLLYKKKGDYKGTDITPEYIEEAKKAYPQYQWEVQDANNLTEPDKTWDIVMTMHTLEYTGGYKEFLERALKIAKKRVIIVFWQNLFGDGDIFHRYRPEDTFEPMWNIYNKETFKKIIRDNGGNILIEHFCIYDGRVPNYIWVIDV